jgi:hypothetical protein
LNESGELQVTSWEHWNVSIKQNVRKLPTVSGMISNGTKSAAGSVSAHWRRLFTVNAYGVFTQIHDMNQKKQFILFENKKYP